MVRDDNPAGRLYLILAAVREHGPSNDPVNAWRLVLGPASEADLRIELAGVSSLIVEIYDQLRALEGTVDVDRYLKWMPRWTRFLMLSESTPQAGAGFAPDQVASEDEMDVLASLSDLLRAHSPRPKVNGERLTILREEIARLIESIISADDIEPDLKNFLLGHLQQMERAIRHLRIYGPEGLDEAIGRVFADIAQRPTWWSKVKATRAALAFIGIFDGVMQAKGFMDNTVELANTVDDVRELIRGD